MQETLHPTTLVFPDLQTLWQFSKTLKVTAKEINTTRRSLTCLCSGQEIERAQESFQAIVSTLSPSERAPHMQR